MSVVLFRVDERLVHGQVVVGWGSRLHPDAYLVIDDALAESAWEQELYRAGLPDEVETRFVSVETARDLLARIREDSRRWFALARTVESMERLARGGGLAGETVNLGGIYAGPGRTERLSYLHLSDPEVEALRRLEKEGVEIEAQDLPGSRQVRLPALLR